MGKTRNSYRSVVEKRFRDGRVRLV